MRRGWRRPPTTGPGGRRGGGLPREEAVRWVRAWDRQQAVYIPERERRFSAMFDALEAYLPPRFLALDLACGPGSLSERLLKRFPQARVVALDHDPVLLELGRMAELADPRRLTWVDADLRAPGWTSSLPVQAFDAVLSTTALHWLSREHLERTYRAIHDLLRPRGIFLNGDAFPYGPSRPIFRSIAHAASARWQYLRIHDGELDWGAWWARLEERPDLHGLFELRRARFPRGEHRETSLTQDEQEALLRSCDFLEPTVIWRDLSNGVMMAIRGDRGGSARRSRTGRARS